MALRNPTQGAATIVADVRLSDDIERIIVTPRKGADAHSMAKRIRESLPSVRIRQTAEGFVLSTLHSGTLLRIVPFAEACWTEEAVRAARNRAGLQRRASRLSSEVSRIVHGGARTATTYLRDISGLAALDPHQIVNVAAMTVPNSYGLCIFDEQGAGKTVTLIYAFDVLVARDEIDFALIVAPKSMISEWPHDFERFKGDLYKIVVAAGTRREKVNAFRAGSDVIVTNFETATSMEAELRALLRSRGERAMLVVDESFYIKNLDSKRTRALRRLREFCARAYVLCGTPAPNSATDIVQQFNLVDFGLTFAGFEIPQDRAKAARLVQQVIEERGVFVRHLKKDVLPALRPKRFSRVTVAMAPVQQRLYESTLQSLIADTRATSPEQFLRNISSFMARRNALLQICSNPAAIVSDYNETPAKLRALDTLLDELVLQRGEKVVLWSFYRASLDCLYRRFGRFNAVRYDGSVNDVRARREAVRRFQEDDDTMLFIANPAAAGAGLTLHRACIAIYESMSNQAAHYLQSIDRIHRRGQSRAVDYIVLLCDKTIEQAEYHRLTEKECAAQALLGDSVDSPVTRAAFLAELSSAAHLLRS
jgi:SNF2 family DNA or RNA helicase